MTAALVLLGYAAAAATVGPRLLTRTGWAARSPRSGVLAWQVLSTTVVLAVLLAAVALALPFLPLRFPLADVLGTHPLALVEHYETPLGAWPGLLGLLAAGSGLLLLAATALRSGREVARGRRAQRDLLRLVGRRHPEGFTVLDHEEPTVYCVPGRARAIVVTTGALGILTDQQRRLVLGHERRHLRGRHHLALGYSAALAGTFGWVRLFAEAHRRIAVLVEMSADDAARGVAERRVLAEALVALSAGVRPATLAAGDTAALERVRRLTRPVGPTWRGQGALVAVAAATVLSIPVTLAAAPAIEAATRDCCTMVVPTVPTTRG